MDDKTGIDRENYVMHEEMQGDFLHFSPFFIIFAPRNLRQSDDEETIIITGVDVAADGGKCKDCEDCRGNARCL